MSWKSLRDFPHLMGGNDRTCLLDGRKGMQRPGKIKKCEEENPCQSEKDALNGISNFVWASGSGGE